MLTTTTTRTTAATAAAAASVATDPAPPPSKRPKINESSKNGEYQQDFVDGDDKEEEEEEMTFTACQILCGNLDHSLLPQNDAEDIAAANDDDDADDDEEEESFLASRRAQAVLDLFHETYHDGHTTVGGAAEWKWTLDHDVKNSIRAWEDLRQQHLPDYAHAHAHAHAHALLHCLILGKRIDIISRSSPSRPSSSPSRRLQLPLWKLIQPAIVSNAHVLLANHCMDQALSSSSSPSTICQTNQLRVQSFHEKHLHHLQQALKIWPCNPSAILSLANRERMRVGKTTTTTSNNNDTDDNNNDDDRQRLQWALDLYLAAAKCAWMTQYTSMLLLENNSSNNNDGDDDDDGDGDNKFLVETILLELSAQVVATDDEDEEDETNNKNNNNNKTATPTRDTTATINSSSNSSKALVIATYMSAMLASTLGQHDVAKRVLERFCAPASPMTRIHPAVWEAAMGRRPRVHPASSKIDGSGSMAAAGAAAAVTTQASFVPCGFSNTIPPNLFDTLRYAFCPDAPYWKESQYDRNVYYSFWTDWPLLSQPTASTNGSSNYAHDEVVVSNAIEDYIVTCLLPRVRAVKGVDMKRLQGFEWWVHTRPVGANLGHQLHFDTDEALLDQDSILDVPLSASVTYLTIDEKEKMADDGNHQNHQLGATMLFDQTPQSKENAQVVWISKPQSKAFVAFPGDLLHGVLPCVTSSNHKQKDSPKSTIEEEEEESRQQHHRLTLMVNFWATRIPDRIKDRKLYGPSGPFPPRTAEHSWVEDIMGAEYPRTVKWSETFTIPPCPDYDGVVCVSPAWETITIDDDPLGSPAHNHNDDNDATKTNQESTHSSLDTPSPRPFSLDKEWEVPIHSLDTRLGEGVHQRFFVTNAPEFFQGTLYEK